MEAATTTAVPPDSSQAGGDFSSTSKPEETTNQQNDPANGHTRSSKFRFKSSKRRSRRDASPRRSSYHDDKYSHERSNHHQHYRRRHREVHRHRSSKRQKSHSSPSPPSPGYNERSLSPETAFRESLFDAMADDEGAAYWESVYGQPIHTYAVPSVPKGPDGELERMTEEEYAAYVRTRMWERSHEGIMEERERQKREKAKAKKHTEEARQRDEERMRFDQAMEESLRRGEERRRAKSWKAVWEKYEKSWEELNAASSSSSKARAPGTENSFHIRNHIYWPVETGKRRDINRDAIKKFLWNAPVASESKKSADVLSTLKAERVRWHPDKMLHRYGNLGLNNDKSLIQSVTEVFQILDDLWIEERGRQSRD